MLKPVERMIAWRYLLSKSDEGFVSAITYLSFIGILLGVMTLVLVSAVMGGARQGLVNQILGLSGHITIEGRDGSPLADTDPVLDRISGFDNLKHSTPLIEEQVLLTSASNAAGGVAFGLPDAALQEGTRFIGSTVSGSVEDVAGWQVMLSRDLAINLDVGVGDQVELLSPKGYETPFGWSPRVKKVLVAGVFTGEQDKPLILMPLDKAQLFFRLKSQFSRLEITTQDTSKIDEAFVQLQDDLGEAYRVQSWKDFYRAFVSALDIERIVVMIVLALIVIVAAFNIIAGQTMLVQEKGKGIAVLRTMGAERRSVLKIFLMAGAIIGIVGTIVGTILGLILAINFEAIIGFLQSTFLGDLLRGELAWLAQVSPIISWTFVAFVFLFSISMSILAALYPAWRAAAHDPVEALRYE